jgi:hypothetical protein
MSITRLSVGARTTWNASAVELPESGLEPDVDTFARVQNAAGPSHTGRIPHDPPMRAFSGTAPVTIGSRRSHDVKAREVRNKRLGDACR